MDAVSSSQLKQTLLLLFAIHLLLPSIQATIVKYCDNKGNYDVKIHGVEISPDPVVPGNPATFNISASTAKSISGGKVDIYVSYFSVLVHKETHDLCEEISCPVKVGNFLLSHTQTLSGFTPPGSYTLKLIIKDENNDQLSCISFNFKIHLGNLVSDN
ncbi:hypothetical protein P3X46_010531 [Hevea brasiliensis]|uniref:MD-2-related lipid-recognition domain-containing protein n=1 Tax=Hevea brasiliensis TaxID=3981 RepID=A0ABQ9MEE2_HEVBR|nr:uncharacterized protein LOC110658932 isoform X4 [Hevea brasiliensis]KAJ9178664.1 hypothetical protein P3X46_010531 [Hevea brasiliensis]